MARKRIQLSKSLVQAVIFSLLSILVITIAAFLIMVNTPNTVYNKILNFMILNRFNSEVYYTEYFRRLSLIANEEDWMIVTPISYLFGGFVYGWIVAPKRLRSYTLGTSALTGLFFSLAVLLMCNYSSSLLTIQASENGIHMVTMPFNFSSFMMGVIQTAYWVFAYILGTFTASLIRTTRVHPAVTLQTTPS